MTRIDFYSNVQNKLDVVRKLILKARQSDQCVLVRTSDDRVAQELETYLWTAPALSFLPHVRCGHPLANRTPIHIGASPDQLAACDVLINLDLEEPAFFGRFKRLLEVVGAEPAEVEAGRRRYRFYKERGYELHHNDLGERRR